MIDEVREALRRARHMTDAIRAKHKDVMGFSWDRAKESVAEIDRALALLEQYEVVEGRAQIDKEWGDNCSCSRTPMYQHVTGCIHIEEDSIVQYVGDPAILLVKKP